MKFATIKTSRSIIIPLKWICRKYLYLTLSSCKTCMFYIKGQAVITLGKLSWYHFLYRTQTYHCLVGSRLASQVGDDTGRAATGGGTSKSVAENFQSREGVGLRNCPRAQDDAASEWHRCGTRYGAYIVRSHFVDGGSLSLLPSFIPKSSTFSRALLKTSLLTLSK
jgi:hypothetical protein